MPLQPDGYTFALSDQVTRTPVRYTNRYGIEIAADLYLPKEFDDTVSHPAIVVGPPHGGVKEQGPGVYAQELARRGFVAIGFDPSYNGESGGQARRPPPPDGLFGELPARADIPRPPPPGGRGRARGPRTRRHRG